MKSILTYASLLTFVFFVLRVILFKFTRSKEKDMKEILSDSCVVFVSCYIVEFLSKRLGFRGIESGIDLGSKSTLVFTDTAGF